MASHWTRSHGVWSGPALTPLLPLGAEVLQPTSVIPIPTPADIPLPPGRGVLSQAQNNTIQKRNRRSQNEVILSQRYEASRSVIGRMRLPLPPDLPSR